MRSYKFRNLKSHIRTAMIRISILNSIYFNIYFYFSPQCSIFEFAHYQTPKTPKLHHSVGFFDFGGDAFTGRIMDRFFNNLKKSKGQFAKLCERMAKDPEGQRVLKRKLRAEVEKAKAALMELDETRYKNWPLKTVTHGCKKEQNRTRNKKIDPF